MKARETQDIKNFSRKCLLLTISTKISKIIRNIWSRN